MDIKKIKSAHYISLKLDPESHRYLRDYTKYESMANIRSAERLLSECLSSHVRALYFMTYAKLLEEQGRMKKDEFRPVVDQLEKTMIQFERILDRGLIRLRKKKVK